MYVEIQYKFVISCSQMMLGVLVPEVRSMRADGEKNVQICLPVPTCALDYTTNKCVTSASLYNSQLFVLLHLRGFIFLRHTKQIS
jgi:hypothetical protein